MNKIKKIEINIPNIKKEYKFLQISDLHMYLSDDREVKARRDIYNWRQKEYWIRDNINPQDRLLDYVEYAKSNNETIVITGDIFDVPSKGNFDLLNNITKSLKDYIFVLGNHDWSYMDWLYKIKRFGKIPANPDYHSEYSKRKYLPLFRNYEKNLNHASYEYDDFIIATLYSGNGEYAKSQVNFLKKLYKLNKPIILFTHVPFYSDEDSEHIKKEREENRDRRICSKDRECNEITKEMYDLVTSKSSPIIAIFAGHIHVNSFGHLINGIPQYICGSSAWGNVNEIIIKSK